MEIYRRIVRRLETDAGLVIGNVEGSPFHETFGYYAQGVWEDTAVLPVGGKERLVAICNENTRSVTALCLDPHDLAVAKLVAAREKDFEFLEDMNRHGLLDTTTLRQRIERLPQDAGDGVDLHMRCQRIDMRSKS